MATVKVKLRPSSVKEKAGTVFYQVTHNRRTLQITTSLHWYAEEWDYVHACPFADTDENALARSQIAGDVALLQQIISQLESMNVTYSVADIVYRFKNPESRVCLLNFTKQQITLLRKSGQLGTAQNYEKTLNSFSQFLGGRDIPIHTISAQLIANYSNYLAERGIVRNSISFYMRILRAVYNKAAQYHLATESNPFQNVYTGVDRTGKRAIEESLIAYLSKLELPVGSLLDRTRDLFLFSYCTRGMAFVDMAYLQKSNLQNGIICYTRHKTNQRMEIRIEPLIKEIIDKYASSSPYLFPILKEQNAEENYRHYKIALNLHNSKLHELSKMLPSKCKITSYTARHSWATVARNHHIPLSVISAGLGHTSERTTQIYLAMLENSVIDNANKKIMNALR